MAKSGERAGRGRPKNVSAGNIKPEELPDIGITRLQSARWQDLARIPERAFERFVKGEKPTERKIAAAARPAPEGYDDQSLERRGAFARLAYHGRHA